MARSRRNAVLDTLALPMLAMLLVAVGVISAPQSASAAGIDETLIDPRPQNSWGVDGLDPGSGNFQYYSPVFALLEVGDTMVVGGKFLEVTNGAESHDQPYLASFDVDTGDWLPTFDPEVTWSVFDLAADPAANRLFVGGEFPSLNGDTTASGFATIDPVTGDLDASFGVRVSNSNGLQPRVHALEASDGWLYLGGSFNTITGADGVSVSVDRLARVSLASGVVDSTWSPVVTGGSVWEIAADETNGRILFGGTFTEVDGIATAAFAMVEISDGSLSDYDIGFGMYYYGQGSYSFASAIEVTGDRYLIGGQRHRLIVADSDLNVLSVHVTNRYFAANNGRGGDIQAIEIAGDIAYVACHCWGQISREEVDKTPTGEYTDVRSVYAVDLATGELIEWFQPDFSGTSGPWALEVDVDDCLWLGTDAVQSGQRAARGVVKLCAEDNLAALPVATASLSSTSGLPFDAAANAIDGDYRTNDRMASGFAISSPEETPHLDIDLGALSDVDDVILWARTDAERLDLQNVHVWASSVPFTTDDWDLLRADPLVTERTRLGSHAAKRTLSIDVNRTVRYLRIEVDFAGATDSLQLAEVAVTGTPTPVDQGITLTSTYQNRERIVLRWQPSGPVTIFRDDVEIGADNDGWFTDTGLAAGTTYSYRIETPAGATATVEASTLGAPANELVLTSTYQSRERVVLRWQPSGPVTIFRDGIEIATDNDGWFTDLGLSAETSYSYRVETPGGDEATLVVSTR